MFPHIYYSINYFCYQFEYNKNRRSLRVSKDLCGYSYRYDFYIPTSVPKPSSFDFVVVVVALVVVVVVLVVVVVAFVVVVVF